MAGTRMRRMWGHGGWLGQVCDLRWEAKRKSSCPNNDVDCDNFEDCDYRSVAAVRGRGVPSGTSCSRSRCCAKSCRRALNRAGSTVERMEHCTAGHKKTRSGCRGSTGIPFHVMAGSR